MNIIHNKHCRICTIPIKLCCFCVYNNKYNNTKYDTNEYKCEYKSIWKFNY